MAHSQITEQILQQVDRLSPEQQERVLAFVRALSQTSPQAGRDILHLAGTIDAADLDVMRQVADEACEQVDPDAW